MLLMLLSRPHGRRSASETIWTHLFGFSPQAHACKATGTGAHAALEWPWQTGVHFTHANTAPKGAKHALGSYSVDRPVATSDMQSLRDEFKNLVSFLGPTLHTPMRSVCSSLTVCKGDGGEHEWCMCGVVCSLCATFVHPHVWPTNTMQHSHNHPCHTLCSRLRRVG